MMLGVTVIVLVLAALSMLGGIGALGVLALVPDLRVEAPVSLWLGAMIQVAISIATIVGAVAALSTNLNALRIIRLILPVLIVLSALVLVFDIAGHGAAIAYLLGYFVFQASPAIALWAVAHRLLTEPIDRTP